MLDITVRCRRLRAAFWITVAGLCTLPVAHATAPSSALSLPEATRRVLADNPHLKVLHWRLQARRDERQQAALTPAYRLGLEVENIAGSGDFSGTAQADTTLSLSSIIELGDQRSARESVAESRYQLARTQRRAEALDLVSAVTQQFIATLALQEKLAVARDASALAQQRYTLVSERVERGAAPEAERLRAQASRVQAGLRESALVAELESRKYALASHWNGARVDFDEVRGDLFRLEPATEFDVLYRRVAESPDLQVSISEERLRDAEIALSRSQSTANVQWSLGVRHMETTGDNALTASISVPLFSGKRGRSELSAAMAMREQARHQRDAVLLSARARLFEAWQTYRQSAVAARRIRGEVVPSLQRALRQTEQAYRQGRYRYTDWVSAQRELLDARLAAINAASTALLNQALIEQLTAAPLARDENSTDFE